MQADDQLKLILTEPAETFLYSPDNRHKINQQELSTETNGHQKFQ